MKKPLSLTAVIAAVVAALAVAAFFILRGTGSSEVGGTADDWRLNDALEAVHGDISKLNPEDRKRYDEFVKRNPNGPSHGQMPPEYGAAGGHPSSPGGS